MFKLSPFVNTFRNLSKAATACSERSYNSCRVRAQKYVDLPRPLRRHFSSWVPKKMKPFSGKKILDTTVNYFIFN